MPKVKFVCAYCGESCTFDTSNPSLARQLLEGVEEPSMSRTYWPECSNCGEKTAVVYPPKTSGENE